jgi:predicted RNA-binding Zn-ribbon protein involved in translation (DUF1610 family)
METSTPPERLKRLTLGDATDGAHVAFCPACDFQLEPATIAAPFCPECGTRLRVITITAELRAVIGSH